MYHKGDLVYEAMTPRNKLVVLNSNDFFRTAIEALDKDKLGVVTVTDENERLVGILTDGDIRRVIIQNQDPLPMLFSALLKDYMTENPIAIRGDVTVKDALKFMNNKKVWVLPVVEGDNILIGLVHMQDLLEGFLSS